ncbi:thymidylate kinase [Brachionus plicatilis]|uniref:Thymidylate kinase n=1 Tax=Brachionus plicatilis TaxID=10195 RepID=A0A3M7QN55_BRAPC|nr:thymidylate kinase [Brachionus plicatilis]
MAHRGLLIVFEGLDRSGKSTQVKLLADALNLKNLKSEIWRYPNRDTSIGGLINDYLGKKIELEDHAVHLLFSANRWETVSEMKRKLNSGINLIVDRYAYSGVAYTSAKEGFELEWCKQCDTGLPKPDLVFFMDTKIDELEKRQHFGEERYENIEFQKKVYSNFKKLFNFENLEDCLVLNARDTIDNLHQIIFKKTFEMIKNENFLTNKFSFLW